MSAKSSDGLDELRQRMGLEPIQKNAGKVRCLKCEKRFEPSDRFRIRICDGCKNGSLRGTSDADAIYPADPGGTSTKTPEHLKRRKTEVRTFTAGGRRQRAAFQKKRKKACSASRS